MIRSSVPFKGKKSCPINQSLTLKHMRVGVSAGKSNAIFSKHTLNEITCDKYLYFYSSRQNGELYVNRKLAYPKSKLHIFSRRFKVKRLAVDDS